MADKFAAVAEISKRRRDGIDPVARPTASFAEQADHGVELFSRWAGIASFGAAVAGIAWLIT